jgi:hypothetical protein
MRGNRLPLLVVALLTVGGVAFGGFRLQQELGKAQPAAQCIQDPKDLENPAEAGPPLCQPFPTPACSSDPKTGLPLPGSNQYCPPIALCETCPLPTIAPDVPTIDFGPFAPNPAAVLTSPPQHRVGDAVALGRTDCPAGWRALVSDTTAMSVCFPAEATLYGPSPESGGYGWGAGDRWDEAATVVLPEGDVTAHRIGAAFGGTAAGLFPDVVGGLPVRRYDRRGPDGSPLDPSLLLQESFGYVLERGEFVWEVKANIRLQPPGNQGLTPAKVAAARLVLEQVMATVRVP